MPNEKRVKIVYRRTPEFAVMVASVKRAMAITAKLNRLMYDDADEIRAFPTHELGHNSNRPVLDVAQRVEVA